MTGQAPDTSDAPPVAEKVHSLKDLLQRQLQAAKADEFDAVVELGQEAKLLLKTIGQLDDDLPQAVREELETIRELHRSIGLTLSQRRAEAAEKLKQLQNGKDIVRLYGGNLPAEPTVS